MKTQPQGKKFKYCFSGKKAPKAVSKGSTLEFGSYGIKAITGGRIPFSQIEAIRVVIKRMIKKSGKLFFRIFPQTPISKKPIGVRMGGGKGSIDHWVSIVNPGKIICELEGLSEERAMEVFNSVRFKTNLQIKFVRRAF